MGNRVLQLSEGANWELFYTTSVNAVTSNNGESYSPIPEIKVPTLVYSRIIAVLVTCSNARSNWHFAGYLNQKINLGITIGNLSNTDSIQKRKLWLDRVSLIIFPKLVTNYSISFEVPKWFEQASIIAWEYKGVDDDSVEQSLTSDIQPALARIEQKIDDISDYGSG